MEMICYWGAAGRRFGLGFDGDRLLYMHHVNRYYVL